MKVSISTQKVKDAIQALSAAGTPVQDFVVGEGTTMSLVLDATPRPVLDMLMKRDSLTPNQKKLVAKQLGVSSGVKLTDELKSPHQFNIAMNALDEIEGYNAEVQLGQRWYPLKVGLRMYDGMFGGKTCWVEGNVHLAPGFSLNIREVVSEDTFRDEAGEPVVLTLEEAMGKLGLRPVTRDSVTSHRKRQVLASKWVDRQGTQVLVTKVLVNGRWGQVNEVTLGTKEEPGRAVVDMLGELQQTYGMEEQRFLPFVRVFSLFHKQYVFADVEDIVEYQYDDKAIERLTLPEKLQKVVTGIFNAANKGLFGDVISSRHGGMIALANGGPGVGKTLTAEVFAEHTHRPLYVMEIGELGVNVNQLEANLQTIFDRVSRWNAVLLFDEADVFLHKRGDDIQHNAIVGIFLRLMDYYKGLLFMTTNRADVIDPAFKSRITLMLQYPDLDQEARKKVWTTMFKVAGFKHTGNLDEIAKKAKINGRQIRNMVRLLKVMYPTGEVTNEQIQEALEFNPQ